MQQEIEAWLAGPRNYSEGIELYRKYGHYNSVITLLEKGKPNNELFREKLAGSLQELLVKLPPVKIFAPLPKTGAQKPAAIPTPETDEYLLQLERKWKPLYTEMATLHSRLLAVETDEARLSLATRIVAIHEQLVTYWQQRDYYQATGEKMPVKKRAKVKSDISQTDLRKLLNARSARSQYQNIHLPKWQARLAANPTESNKERVAHMLKKIETYNAIITQYEQNN